MSKKGHTVENGLTWNSRSGATFAEFTGAEGEDTWFSDVLISWAFFVGSITRDVRCWLWVLGTRQRGRQAPALVLFAGLISR